MKDVTLEHRLEQALNRSQQGGSYEPTKRI